MKGKRYILLKAKIIPVWLKYWAYKKGGVTPVLKNLYLGYSRQTQTTGKNVMPINSYNSNDQRQLQFNFDLPAGTYTISYDLINFDIGTNNFITIYMGLYGATSQIVDVNLGQINSQTQLDRKQVTFTTTESITLNSRYSTLRIPNTQYENGGRATISNIQIEAGTEATPFEQYTGGIPAPNYDYPIEIEHLTGNVSIRTGDKVVIFPLSEGQILLENTQLTPNGILIERNTRTFTGTETLIAGTILNNLYGYFYSNSNVAENLTDSINVKGNYLIGKKPSDVITNGIDGICSRRGENRYGIYWRYPITVAETEAEMKQYFADLYSNNKPFKAEYKLKTPLLVPYTEAQLQAYTNLCKYFEENTDLNNYIVEGG